MNINEFVHSRRAAWERYRSLLERVERRNWRALAPDEIDEFAALYRGVSADLASAKTSFGDTELAAELNELVSRGYTCLYTPGPSSFAKIVRFLTHGYPALIADNIRPVLFSFFIFIFFTGAGYVAQSFDRRLADSMVPKPLLKSFEQEIRKRPMERDILFSERSPFSTQIMTNNIQVSIVAFAGGVMFGLGTLYIMITNAMLLGILMKLFADYGRTLNFFAFILPHGVLELPAIILSAAAGFIVGYSLINPKGLSRGDSLRKAALTAVRIMFGVVAMLIVAGIIEGFVTPIRWVPDLVKVIFAGIIFILLLLYLSTGFTRAGRRGGASLRGTK